MANKFSIICIAKECIIQSKKRQKDTPNLLPCVRCIVSIFMALYIRIFLKYTSVIPSELSSMDLQFDKS